MPRTRVIYASQALFVGPSPAQSASHVSGNIRQLYRVQSASFDFNIRRSDVNQYGDLAAIDRVILESPTVNLNFSYLATNAYNESGLGLVTDGSVSAIASLLDKTQDEKNYFILTMPEGIDANGTVNDPSLNGVVGVGNGFLSSYSFEASVGALPTASVKIEGLNVEVYNTSSGADIPAVNPADGSKIGGSGFTFQLPHAISGEAGQVSALRPGDITLDLVNLPLGVDLSDAKIQRFSVGFDLQREPQEKLGSPFAFSREIKFPVNVTISIEANVGDLVTGSLSDVICNDQDYNLGIILNKPSCPGTPKTQALRFDVLGAKFDSQNFQGSIGPNERVTINFTAQIGSAAQLTKGLFISGAQV